MSGQGGQRGPKSKKAALSTASTMSTVSTALYPEFSANAALTLLSVACALLDRQVDRLARDFETGGGFTERLYNVRSEKRKTTVVGGEGGEVNPRIMAIRYRLG